MLLFYPTLVWVSTSDRVYFFQLGIFQQPIPASRLATDRQLTWSWRLVGSIWSSFGPWDGLKIWDTWKGRGYLQMMKWQPWSCGFLALKNFLTRWWLSGLFFRKNNIWRPHNLFWELTNLKRGWIIWGIKRFWEK